MNKELLCPLDKNPLKEWMYVSGDRRRPSKKTSYQLYWCEKCKYGILHPRASKYEDTLQFYSVEDRPFYTHSNESSNDKTQTDIKLSERLLLHLAWRFDKGVELSASTIDKLIGKKATILEIGCGAGQLLLDCQKLGHSVLGIEPDPEARKVSLDKGLQVKNGTAESLPDQLQKKYFDVIVMKHVLEHCLDPILALSNLKELLKPGGIFVCEVPNNSCIAARWAGTSWSHLGVPRHINFFTEKSLTTCIQKAGLKVVSSQFRGYCRQFKKENINLEQKSYDFFTSFNNNDSLPVRPSFLTRWIMLIFSAMASPSHKYDSVIVISRLI